ncbi:DUF3780 domain-containing protein [Planococcus halocryophilus]|uniref:DUF3780 domain-containing protein n=1 Tax=Planococcus halocryophilus TaxID=1215089 RepID=UPI001F0F1974|nr:DUF3780 domain-containing protein [Planococcus halocryophilus]MCH4828062.1 DUF3780 domain-containing protein [Planococcus halocryophilus]
MKNTFGLLDVNNENNFKVVLGEDVRIVEEIKQKDLYNNTVKVIDVERARINLMQWAHIKAGVSNFFNHQLRETQWWFSFFITGENYMQNWYGKQLLLLVWAIEDTKDPDEIHRILMNWIKLSEGEQWWLFTVIEETSEELPDRNGWRRDLKKALLSNSK